MEEDLPALTRPLPPLQRPKYTTDTPPNATTINLQGERAPDPSNLKNAGFLKSVDMILSGSAQGILEFTGRLLNQGKKITTGATKGTILERPEDTEESPTTAAYKYWDKKNEADRKEYRGAGFLQGVGKLPAELITLSPTVKAASLLGKGAEYLGKAVQSQYGLKTIGKGIEGFAAGNIGKSIPVGFQKAGEYGAEAVKGTGVLAAMEGQRFDPNNPDQPFSIDQSVLESPIPYALSAAGHGLGNYVKSAQDLAQAKTMIPKILNSQLDPRGASRTAKLMMFGAPYAITGAGKFARQLDDMEHVFEKFASDIAGGIPSGSYPEVSKLATQHIQMAGKRLEVGEDLIWNKGGFLNKPISDPNAVKQQAEEVKSLLEGNTDISGANLTIKNINRILSKPKMTIEEAKQIHSEISKAKINALAPELGGTGIPLAKELQTVKENLMTFIKGSLGEKDSAAFAAASDYTARKYEFYDAVPKFQGAIENEVEAFGLLESLIGRTKKFDKQALLSELPQKGKDAMGAAFVAKALQEANHTGKFNITNFLKHVNSRYSEASNILDEKSYKALQGFEQYLLAAQEYKGVGWWRQMAIATGVGITGAISGPAGVAAAISTYGAAQLAANHSPVKTLLNGLIQVSSKVTNKESSSIYQYIIKALDKQFYKAGYLMTEDGELQHKDQKEIPKEE